MSVQKVRVLHIASELGIGGTEKTLQIFCEYLNRDFFEPSICGIYRGGLRADILKQKGFETHVLNGDYSRLESLLRDDEIDLIHTYLGWNNKDLNGVAEAANRAGVPVIVETNVFGYFNRDSAERFVDRHLLISKSVALEYAARGKITMAQFLNKCRVLYNPVDFAEFQKEAPSQDQVAQFRRKIGVEADSPLICRVGRPDVRKWTALPVNMMWFLARKIPDVKYLIVGGMPSWVRRKIARYHLEDSFIDFGVASEKELITIYYAVDLLAHSSRIGESFGCTIAEAMAAKKPVVVESTPWGDNAQIELVDNGVTGFVATTSRTYADAVAYLLGHPTEAQKMGKAGYEKAERMFDAKRVVPLLEKQYVELLRAKGVGLDVQLRNHCDGLVQFPSNQDILNYPVEYLQRMSNLYGKTGLHERAWLKIKQYTQGRPSKAYIFKDSHLHVAGL